MKTKYLVYFAAASAGVLIYPLIEILWRGYTHPTMAAAGGVCSFLLYYVSDRFREASVLVRMLASATLITFVELLFGIVFNLVLGLGVWDYAEMPGQLLGQICLPYFFLWFLLSLPVTFLFARISDRFHA
jgi:uncharacterized membrane protein